MKRVFTYSLLIFFLFFNSVQSQKNYESFKRVGLEHMKNGRYKEAIDVFNKLITAKPQKADGYNLRGLCYEVQERYEYARLDFRRAIALEPSNREYKNNLDRVIRVWYKILDAKIEGHKRNIAIDPNYPFDYLEIGQSHRWKEEWALAEKWYDEYLLRDDNASPDEIIRFSIILAHTGHIAKGEKILKKWVDRYPEDWRLWSRYGYFTMWLGKYKNAENAFLSALNFKPFFKEAEDGLDLARKEGYLTQAQPREFERTYAIDEYYKRIRRAPENYKIRYLLIEELIDKERYQEAKDQLDIIAREHSEEEKYISLRDKLYQILESKYEVENNESMVKLKENPTDTLAVYTIARNYNALEKYEEAIEILQDYLEMKPDDSEALYLYAFALSSTERNQQAYSVINQVIENGGEKLKYKLLAGQTAVWSLNDLDRAMELFDEVLEIDSKNVSALIGKGLVYFNKGDAENLDTIIEQVKMIDSNDPDLIELISMSRLLKLRLEQEKYISESIKADSLMKRGECSEALEIYNEIVEQMPYNSYVYKSRANAQICTQDFEGAISSYDTILENEDSYEIEKDRAKTLFWSGDSSSVVNEFQKLNSKFPDDIEMLVYLGDSYVREKDYTNARLTYNSVPDSLWEFYKIDERLDWLPYIPNKDAWYYGIQYQFHNFFFSYLNLFGNAYYFNDNLDFTHLYGALGAETSLTSFLNVGVSWRKGKLSDGNYDFTYDRPMLHLGLIPYENWRFNLGYGHMYSDYYNVFEWQAELEYAKKDLFRFSLFFNQGDGAAILYSPYLVANKIIAEVYKFSWDYNIKSKLILRGYWTFLRGKKSIYVEENLGNEFLFRIGRKFLPNLILGYEFNYIDFEFSTAYYYSPQEFSSHSIWGEWQIIDEEEIDLIFDGKIGYVPTSSYIIWDGKLEAFYNPYPNFSMSAFAFLRQTQHYTIGYRSKALGISFRWNPFY